MYGIRLEYAGYDVSQCIPAEIRGPLQDTVRILRIRVSYEIHTEYIRIHQNTIS